MTLHRLLLAFALMVLFTAFLPASSWAQDLNSGSEQLFAPGRILVKFKEGVPRSMEWEILERVQGRTGSVIEQIGVHLVTLNHPGYEEDAIAILTGFPEIDFAELDLFLPVDTTTPNDTKFSSQWHHKTIKSTSAWDTSTGSTSVIIAICDTGVDGSHSDLKASMVAGYNFYDSNTNTADVHGHGTQVAGSAAAIGNNSNGVAGVTWNCKIMPLRVTDAKGYAYLSTIAKAITWAADKGARVANASFAASVSSTIANVGKYMQGKGGVVTISAGNDGKSYTYSDNAYVLTVSATSSSDGMASWSTTGTHIDVAAPGVSILTTKKGGGYGGASGTSFSAPITAGIAALVISTNPQLTGAAAQKIVIDSADDLGATGFDTKYGYGRVNAYAAVALALKSKDTTAPTVSFKTPTSGATVSGTVTVTVTATDDVGMDYVSLTAGGTTVGKDTTSPFTFSWNTSTWTDGSTTLEAIGVDAAGNSTKKSITVTLKNSDSTAPTLSFTTPSGGATVSGTTAVTLSASDNLAVTSVSLTAGGTTIGTDKSSPYSFSWDTTKWTNGSTTLQATAVDAAGNSTKKSITVTVKNADTTAPTLSFTAPSGGATVSGTTTVTLSASDGVGVTSVSLSAGGTTVGTDTSSPFSFSWDTTKVTNGSTTLQATAVDAAGNSTKKSITVTVKNADTTAPTLSFTSPANGATVSGTTSVAISAADNVGVASVTLTANGEMVGKASSSPFNFSWDTTSDANGSTTLQATAVDAAGNSTKKSITVTVKNADTTAPTLSFTAPSGGATVSGTTTVTLSASDGVGVTSVSLSAGGTTVGTDTSSPFSFSWDTTKWTNGSTTLQATAVDAAGNSTKKSITVTVKNADTTAPTLSFTSPANGATVSGTTSVAISAADNVGVASVTLTANGEMVGKASSSPFNFSWDTTSDANGSTTLQATAVDAAGNSTKKSITVTVKNADTTAPTLAFTAPDGGATVSGTTTVTLSASDGVGVTSVSLSAGGTTVGTDTSSPFSFSWDTTKWTNGSTTLQATAVDAAGNSTKKSITVTVKNADTTAPTLSFTAPSGDATVSGTTTVTLSASDGVGVTSVSLSAGGTTVGTDTSSPFSFSWDTTKWTNGSTTLQATAVDAAGNSTKKSITVTVKNADTTAPTLSFTSPSSGATVSGTTTVSLSAGDNVGVASVTLKANGTTVGTDTSSPFSFSWDTTKVTDGSVTLQATASDAAGNTTTKSITVTVKNATSNVTSIAFTSPASGATVSGSVTLTLNASASAGVKFVAVHIGRKLIGKDYGNPYAITFDTTTCPNGKVTLDAKILDNNGAIKRTSISVTVNNATSNTSDTTAPTLSFTSPSSGATVSGTTAVALSASDNIGVASVTLKANGATVGTDTTSPFTFSWDTTKVTNGSVTLQATAVDAAGNSTTKSITVTVKNTVADTTAPTLSFTSPSSGATVSGTTTVTLSAGDNVGVASVTLKANGITVGTDSSSPFSFSCDTTKVADGSVTLQATAVDAAGNTTTKSISVTVKNATSNATSIAFTSHATGATVSGSVTLTLNASASAGVKFVAVHIGRKLVGKDYGSPYAITFDTTTCPNGKVTLDAKILDNNGAIKRTSITVNVQN